MIRTRKLVSVVLGLSFIAAAAASSAEASGRVAPLRAALTAKDKARLRRTALRHRQEIGPHQRINEAGQMIQVGFTPVVDLHIAEADSVAGVRWKKVQSGYDHAGPTIFEVTGIDKVGGVLNIVMTGSASGHVVNPKWGGRPFSTVEEYGRTDMVHLTHKGPKDARSHQVLRFKSQGLVSQEGFSIDLSEKGTHDFFYFRRAGNDAPGSGGGEEGSEPELRHVQIIVK